jgi:hypothetical protein
LDINREKKIVKAIQYPYPVVDRLPLGTIVYGTLLEKREGMPAYPYERFIVEDIYFMEGIPLKKMNMIEKIGFLEKFMKQVQNMTIPFQLFLPSIWKCQLTETSECPTTIPASVSCYLAYPVHHIQYRAAHSIMPFLNVTPSTRGPLPLSKPTTASVSSLSLPILSKPVKPSSAWEIGIPHKSNFSKPQDRHPAVFQVIADLKYDVYHLFAYGVNKQPVYYNVAYVPSYRSSVFLNGLFRKIRENRNLDYIEESDDEEDFENITEDKYVDTQKVLCMECIFHTKFRKWIPTRVVHKGSKIVHINQLA